MTLSAGELADPPCRCVKMSSGKQGKLRVFMVFNAAELHPDTTHLFLLVVAGIQPRFGPSKR